MKNTHYLILLFAIITASCTSNEGIGTAIDENLPEIAEKLKTLETSPLDTEEDQNNFKSANKKRKSFAKNLEDCQHEITENDSYNGETSSITYKFFNDKGQPITDCEIWELDNTSFKYALDSRQVATGTNYSYEIHQYITYERTIKLLSTTSAQFYQSIESDLDGTLNFNEEIFNILDGSYINMEMSFNYSENSNPDYLLDNTYPEIDLKYIIGFEVNSSNYHFELTMDTEGMKALENNDSSNYSAEYNLLNSQNQKIGTVIYTYSQGEETFEVLDLDGNLVTVD